MVVSISSCVTDISDNRLAMRELRMDKGLKDPSLL